MDYYRVVYTLENRVHSVLVPLLRTPEPGETITVDQGRTAVVQTVEHNPERPDGVTVQAELTR
jgi:hypothetical protein